MALNSVTNLYIFDQLYEKGKSPRDSTYETDFEDEVLAYFGIVRSSLTDDSSDKLKKVRESFKRTLKKHYDAHNSRVKTIKEKYRVRKYL